MKIVNNTAYIVMACLTLGLAPFFPEPHVWGKLKWVAGGAVGMQAMDYFDLLMHGFPWLLLIRLIIIKSINALKTSK
ncbi:hypothetical protein R9C00_06305 [Flammeovirgaceae bacterium SG7u.111]|nr:hypothetical protein [Flammeovirgaceae bacterium SG7u.132]WPO37054.1 hypothetical protein R9C00_06305 [Flammeovirgaceae bacterium SG7u.111]